MKRVYITGIAGLLGANIGYLLKEHYKICGVDRIGFQAEGIQCEQFELLDFEVLRESVLKFKPDYLIHTAAMVNVDLCEEERELTYQLNTKLTGYLAELCNEISCKMVYISTDAVFDGKKPQLYNEDDKTAPINYYGETKLLGEEAVLRNDHLVVRTNIYGYNVQDKNSFGEWIYRALQKDESLKMFTDIDFSPILVNDLTEIIVQLLEKEKKGLYHACGTGCITKFEFGMKVKSVFGIRQGSISKAKSDDFAFKAARSKHMGMDNQKVRNELGITIPTPEESIEKFYCLYNKQYIDELKKWGRISNENRK